MPAVPGKTPTLLSNDKNIPLLFMGEVPLFFAAFHGKRNHFASERSNLHLLMFPWIQPPSTFLMTAMSHCLSADKKAKLDSSCSSHISMASLLLALNNALYQPFLSTVYMPWQCSIMFCPYHSLGSHSLSTQITHLGIKLDMITFLLQQVSLHGSPLRAWQRRIKYPDEWQIRILCDQQFVGNWQPNLLNHLSPELYTKCFSKNYLPKRKSEHSSEIIA